MTDNKEALARACILAFARIPISESNVHILFSLVKQELPDFYEQNKEECEELEEYMAELPKQFKRWNKLTHSIALACGDSK